MTSGAPGDLESYWSSEERRGLGLVKYARSECGL